MSQNLDSTFIFCYPNTWWLLQNLRLFDQSIFYIRSDTGAFICFLLKYLWIGKTRIILLISLSHYLLFICCIYLSRINYRMSGTRHKVYSKLMIKASEWIALVFLILKKLLLLLIFEQLHKMLWKHIYER